MSPSRSIVLASASPRRKELLSQLTHDFIIDPADIDEDALTVADPWQTAEGLSLAKAKAVFGRHPEKLVIGSDTVVALQTEDGWKQLAKPKDVQDAEEMLAQLSGREHVVISGVALVSAGSEIVFSDTTKVLFRKITEKEITDYVATGEPMDKAGGYAIQGGAAGFVDSVEGSISNVIGLPMEKLTEKLTILIPSLSRSPSE